MSVIEKIEDQAVQYVESGLICPDSVHLSPDVYVTLLKEMQPSLTITSHLKAPGISTCNIWTTVGQLHVTASSYLTAGSIIVGENAIIKMMIKLGDIF